MLLLFLDKKLMGLAIRDVNFLINSNSYYHAQVQSAREDLQWSIRHCLHCLGPRGDCQGLSCGFEASLQLRNGPERVVHSVQFAPPAQPCQVPWNCWYFWVRKMYRYGERGLWFGTVHRISGVSIELNCCQSCCQGASTRTPIFALFGLYS